MKRLLDKAAIYATDYLEKLNSRSVGPPKNVVDGLERLYEQLPDNPTDPHDVLDILNSIASPATVASAGGRYFGFVTGGTLPASLAANWLAAAWDQNAFSFTSSPVAVVLEEVALTWLLGALDLPPECGGSFVSGATMANFTALAAARHAILDGGGWDVEDKGLFGAPEITVVVGAEAHPTLHKALGLLGLGRNRVLTVQVDNQGRMRADKLPDLSDRSIVCIQAGNVNTGAFDPALEICRCAHDSGAWVHVDGAFGLWAAADPSKAYLVEGYAEADSWATDAHKWLNVPYDSGLAFVRNPDYLHKAMSISAAYLPEVNKREPLNFTPEASRRMRGLEIWAALKSLGRSGLADLVERTCRYATKIADSLIGAGYEVLNKVELNQVLVSFGSAEQTQAVIAGIQTEGTCWCGGTVWQGQTAMRISISSWATTDDDINRSIDAILRVAQEIISN